MLCLCYTLYIHTHIRTFIMDSLSRSSSFRRKWSGHHFAPASGLRIRLAATISNRQYTVKVYNDLSCFMPLNGAFFRNGFKCIVMFSERKFTRSGDHCPAYRMEVLRKGSWHSCIQTFIRTRGLLSEAFVQFHSQSRCVDKIRTFNHDSCKYG